ncbi:LysR family transcriptional regulator [Paraburkholderia humisilvae]|uniref:HTH-type transcriptional regulator DmlR n=1 Tax=Paraburkholderia humisilvae TaxID=627669 RepID=A0A6J5EXZ5_9BURK|nr:LysR family transcriptional regulator [Paraburkholderia humisilvae]CAB3770112.1 HTH-type transcriptional regulator DmlR [Paraburkholderia humisilvae]
MDRFDAMTVFVRVVEAGSLSAAARVGPQSLTSVSRHIAALEERLGTQLLRRTTRHLALTDEGRLFYERAKAILGEMEELEGALSAGRDEPSGRLRVAAPGLIGRYRIAPLLPRFLARYPSVDVDLVLVDRTVDLVEENIHLAVRLGRQPDSSLVARKLAEVHMLTCAAPVYLKRRGTPKSPGDLRDHDCLTFSDTAGAIEWRFRSSSTQVSVRVTGRIWANSLYAVVAAAIEGGGIVRVPSWQVAHEIAAGRLRTLLDAYRPPPTPVYAVFDHARRSSPKVRTFVDYLVDQWAGSDLETVTSR